jgi:HEPN domain-containing protein
MVDRRLVDEWLGKADEDFGFASINLDEDRPFFPQICFHFHQAAEKYLKAYIVANVLAFRKAHDLVLLLQTCGAHDESAQQLRDACEYLSAFYVETRYPVHWPTHFSRDEARRARECTRQIRDWVDARIRPSPTPPS